MINTSNLLSLLRAPLALLFLQKDPSLRVTAILLALITDGLDGYLARRWNNVTQFGALLDPLMDRFFVIFVGSILLSEGSLEPWAMVSLLSRDFAVAIFGVFLMVTGKLAKIQFQSIWTGKVTTFFQFCLLTALSLSIPVPKSCYSFFIVLAVFALIELFAIRRYTTTSKKGPSTS